MHFSAHPGGALPGTGAASPKPPRAFMMARARRKLQLALAAVWLLDGMLQYQPAMFRSSFPMMLTSVARGNPRPVAAPITWTATIVGHHLVLANTVFATIQVLLGVGIALPRTAKLALASSVLWAAGVWWLGEGFGGLLTAAGASPVSGAPGAVILYAVLAVVLWPARFPAARVLWIILWMGEEVCALLPGSRAPDGISSTFESAASQRGLPGTGWIDTRIASVLAGHGLAAAIVLAVTCSAIALSVNLPPSLARTGIVAAIALSALIWLGEAFGGIFTGSGTDPNSGPILALIAAAYWPSFWLPDSRLSPVLLLSVSEI